MELIRYFIFCTFILFSFSINAANGNLPLTINPAWLQQNLSSDNHLIVDVRPKNLYLQGHIENAISFDVELTFNGDLMASLRTIKGLVESRGISANTQLVLYDSGNFIDASRLFWVLETVGHQNVSILNMGYQKWADSNRPISLDEPKRTTTTYDPTIDLSRIKTMIQVRHMLTNNDNTLIDARPRDEYMGLTSKTSRFGHIPTAISIPFTENLVPSGEKLKSLTELSRLYEHLDINKPVVAYCNRGKQSALNYFVLRHLGYKVAAYDGSWLEWSQTRGNPIEK